jgi:hypothetical protein
MAACKAESAADFAKNYFSGLTETPVRLGMVGFKDF